MILPVFWRWAVERRVRYVQLKGRGIGEGYTRLLSQNLGVDEETIGRNSVGNGRESVRSFGGYRSLRGVVYQFGRDVK